MAFDFQSRHALLAGRCAPKGIGPVAKRQTRFFVNRADADGVLLLAFLFAATPKETLVTLAGFGIDHLIDVGRAAMDAARGIAPSLALEEFHCRRLIAAGDWDFPDDIGFG